MVAYNKIDGDAAAVQAVDCRDTGLQSEWIIRVTSNTVLGFALAMRLLIGVLRTGLGGGKSNAIQTGIYGRPIFDPLSCRSICLTNHQMTVDRYAYASDHPQFSQFAAQNMAGTSRAAIILQRSLVSA